MDFFCSFLLQVCHGRSTIVLGQSVADGDSLTSSGGTFELGFFTPGSSPHRYVGIWFKKIPVRKVVWVANRLNPVVGSSGVLQIGEDGNLVIMDGQNLTWSTVVSSVSNGSIVELLDSGNLVLREGDSNGSFIWQSFDYPSDCFLQNMKVGLNLKTGEKRFLTSWRSDNDPSPGNFTLGVDQQKLPQGLVWKGSARYWRTGQWNGTSFLGIQRWGSSWVYLNGFMFVTDDEEGMLYFTYSRYNDTFPSILIMNYTGIFEKLEWIEEMKEWSSVWEAPDGRFVYGTCGPFGICSEFESPICRCLNGFEPKFLDEWSKGDWSGGCVRRTTAV